MKNCLVIKLNDNILSSVIVETFPTLMQGSFITVIIDTKIYSLKVIDIETRIDVTLTSGIIAMIVTVKKEGDQIPGEVDMLLIEKIKGIVEKISVIQKQYDEELITVAEHAELLIKYCASHRKFYNRLTEISKDWLKYNHPNLLP